MNLVQMGLQGSVLIVVVLVVRGLFGRRLPKALLPVLWAIVLVRLLVPACITMPWSAWTIAGQTLAQTETARSITSTGALDTDVLPLVEAATEEGVASTDVKVARASAEAGPYGTTANGATSVLADTGQQVASSTGGGAETGVHAADAPMGGTGLSGTFAEQALVWLAGVTGAIGAAWARLAPWQIIWGVGTIACLLVAGAAYLHVLGRFRHSTPVDDPFALRWLAAHPLHRRVCIRSCGLVRSPMTYGLLRPVILVPPDFDWDDRVKAGLMLEHELVHIRRFDVAFKTAPVVAVCLHWLNPLVWVAYVLANRDLELSCDELVLRRLNIRGRTAYATALIDATEARCGQLPAAVGFGKSDLTRRVLAIVRPAQPRSLATGAAILLVTAATTAFATTGIIPAAETTQAAPDIQGIRITGGDDTAAPNTDTGTAVIPETLGGLAWDGVGPAEFSHEGYRYVVTFSYALVIPESQVTEDFTWNFDDETEYVATHETEAQGTVAATATDVLAVGGVLDAAGQPVSFKVYQQTSGEYKRWSGPCPLGEGYAFQRLTYDTYVAINDGSTPEMHGLNRLVSTGGYAYAQPEEDGTRIMTPAYSVLVPDGALPKGWSFAASSDTYKMAFELRIYEGTEARAADKPLVTYAPSSNYELEQNPASNRVVLDVESPVDDYDYALRAFGPILELGEQDPLWESSRQHVETWAERVSFDITQRTARSVAITRDLWHIETPFYSFDVPELWRGRVTVSVSADGTLMFYPNGYPELVLFQILTYRSVEELPGGGDIVGGAISGTENAQGAYIVAYMVNYVYLATVDSWRNGTVGLTYPGDDMAREVIDLSTGGAHSLEEIEAMPEYGDVNGFAYGRELVENNLHIYNEAPANLSA